MHCLLLPVKHLLSSSKARKARKAEASIAVSVRAALAEVLDGGDGRMGYDEKASEAGLRHQYEFDVWVTKCPRNTQVVFFVGDGYIIDDDNFFGLVAKAFDAVQASEGYQVAFSFRQPRTEETPSGVHRVSLRRIVPVPEDEMWGWSKAGGAKVCGK